jgi:chromosome segregation ATPase
MEKEDMIIQLIQELSVKVNSIQEGQDKLTGRFDNMEGRFDNLEGRFDNLEGRFDNLEVRFDNLEVRLDNLEGRFDNLEGRFDNLEGRFDNLEGRFDNLEVRFDNIEVKFDNLENSHNRLSETVRDLKLHIENVTDKNIQLLMEQYTPNAEKLDKAVKKIEAIEIDVNNIKKVVMAHSSEINELIGSR